LPPQIENRWVCIAGSGKAQLAAQIASYFKTAGVYFAVFDFPELEVPYREVAHKDGYFSQIIGHRSAVSINNAMARIQPDKIILAGLSEAALTYLRPLLPDHRVVIINDETEIPQQPFAKDAPGPLLCKPSQPIEGLIAARTANRPLAFDQNAPDLPTRKLEGKSGLIVLENSAGVPDLSVAIFALSIDADILLVPAVERDEVKDLPRQLQEWADDRSSQALRDARRKVTDRIKGIDFKKYEFATFSTIGLPYGLILENVIPFTHILNGPYCGVVIANSITEALRPMEIGSAVLFSIDEFISDETGDIAKTLEQSNFVVTELIGPNATYNNLSNYGAHFPYDLLHICSHGGETDGYFVKHEFKDRNGDSHTFEYFEVVSFSEEAAIDPGMVKVEMKKIFARFDGVPWDEKPLSKYPQYVRDDLMQGMKDDDNVDRKPFNVPIALSAHIKCYQSFHQGAFDHLAAYSSPIVFNNSCSSSHELAVQFLAAGARCYVGTLWAVGDFVAMQAALAFYASLMSEGDVLRAFTAMQKSISDPEYENIYILWGVHFTNLVRPAMKSDERIIEGLFASLGLCMKKMETTRDPEVKKNSIPMLRFLDSELRRRVSIERLRQIIKARLGAGVPMERSLPAADDTEPNEITITKEIPKPN
jgi:hypothetical protein